MTQDSGSGDLAKIIQSFVDIKQFHVTIAFFSKDEAKVGSIIVNFTLSIVVF